MTSELHVFSQQSAEPQKKWDVFRKELAVITFLLCMIERLTAPLCIDLVTLTDRYGSIFSFDLFELGITRRELAPGQPLTSQLWSSTILRSLSVAVVAQCCWRKPRLIFIGRAAGPAPLRDCLKPSVVALSTICLMFRLLTLCPAKVPYCEVG